MALLFTIGVSAAPTMRVMAEGFPCVQADGLIQGEIYIAEVSTDLIRWTPYAAFMATGESRMFGLDGSSRAFFRIHLVPTLQRGQRPLPPRQ